MFLKSLLIENEDNIIRDIQFKKGINLIVDETEVDSSTSSGNNVGKTTVLRLIDYCLDGKADKIYADPEFKDKNNTQIKDFLTSNKILVTLTIVENFDDSVSDKIVIKRNFLSGKDKIYLVNDQKYKANEYSGILKDLLFKSIGDKPKLRQLIAKNIRHEKEKLENTIRVLGSFGKPEEYEALYLFWLGFDIDANARKQKLITKRKSEKVIQKRLNKSDSIAEIEQSLIIIEAEIKQLEKNKKLYIVNDNYEDDLNKLNLTKQKINSLSNSISTLSYRKKLIVDSKAQLEKEFSKVNSDNIKQLYSEATNLLGNLHKTFEDTLEFHNSMLKEKIEYITQEIPSINIKLEELHINLKTLLEDEKALSVKVAESGTNKEFEEIIIKVNRLYERKGTLLEHKKLWEESESVVLSVDKELETINKNIDSFDSEIQDRITSFNKYFAAISRKLYDESYILTATKSKEFYTLNIKDIMGNPGTGKKKGQIAAFDLAYIQFADFHNIDCLHFILHDQIENVHDNQITTLLTDAISNINCQYIIPILKDKLPKNIDIQGMTVLSLSQNNKLFKI